MTAAFATLAIGAVVGFLAQRSRMCFVGGIRDVILVRDTSLLKGLTAFALAAWLAFSTAALLADAVPMPSAGVDIDTLILTIVGGAGVGFFSTLANGCPLRQHVLAAQGARSSLVYVVGFYSGAVIFHAWVAGWLVRGIF